MRRTVIMLLAMAVAALGLSLASGVAAGGIDRSPAASALRVGDAGIESEAVMARPHTRPTLPPGRFDPIDAVTLTAAAVVALWLIASGGGRRLRLAAPHPWSAHRRRGPPLPPA